jgi:hypothetical protein
MASVRARAVARRAIMPNATHAATGRMELALTVAAAALLPVRMALHYACQSPPSRPMAAVTLLHESREDQQATRAGRENVRSRAVPGRVAKTATR